MESDPKLPLITYFTDPLLLNYITEFLTIREKLLISSLSKKLEYIMEQHFKALLADNKLHLIQGKTARHQMHFYFGRVLHIFKPFKEPADNKE